MLLLKICSAWTSIALSTPALWAAIGLVFPCAEGFEEGVEAWLRRACNRPLSVSLRGQLGGAPPIIQQYGERLKHLEICGYDEYDDGEEPAIDLVGGPSLGLPLLETLTIRASENGRGFYGTQILDLLRSAPNLTEAIFENMNFMYSVVPSEKVVLPALRRLMFGEDTEHPDTDDGILSYISLPGLQTLSVLRDASNLFSFLKHSLPPLQELILGEYSPSLVPLVECLRLVPTLTRFKLCRSSVYLVAEFFAALAESYPVVPNLHSLTIYLNSSTITDSSWKTLLRALSSRRTQLQIVHIGMIFGSPALAPEILDGFRQLAADGMQVYVGTNIGNRNFLLD
jgi:hypothetical protein